MGMRGETNTWLSCTVLLHMLNIILLEQLTRGRRAWEGSKQHAHCRLERDRKLARQKRQQHTARDLEPEHWKGKSGSEESLRRTGEQCAHRLEGNRQQAREKTM